METFTGREYLQIDIANCFGLDRLDWADRIHWFENNEPDLEAQAVNAKSPILYRKAVRALRVAQQGKPVNHVMGLDATASGLQIMGLLSGCVATAEATNLVNTGHRRDVYDAVARQMQAHGCLDIDRTVVKKPVMTVFYGSKAQPKAIFGEESPELFAFYDSLREKLPGAFELMDILQSYWRSDVTHHSWTLPDGHKAVVPVIEIDEKKLEIDELDHMRVTYRTKVLSKKRNSRALAANIVHSIDGWVVRMMVRGAAKRGFWIAPIHDCFYAHPNHMNDVRQLYVEIMTWLSKNNILQSILSDIAGYQVRYNPRQHGLSKLVPSAEYALS